VHRDPAGTDAIGEFLRGDRLAVQFRLEDLDRAAVGAGGQAAPGLRVEKTP